MNTDKPTCGECKFYEPDNRIAGWCSPKLPPWAKEQERLVPACNKAAERCECFERKDTK